VAALSGLPFDGHGQVTGPEFHREGGDQEMYARVPVETGPAAAAAAGSGPRLPRRTLSPVTGGELLALATSLRARGLRGLDELRRNQDRAPPGVR
jgi:hypothetical protein